ncbi:MAG: immunoglobulin domain-containing protein [Chthoniobacterales bacterium]|nr:immunoglobulin domain-containing protein [Chthoniobacterales bacterium]
MATASGTNGFAGGNIAAANLVKSGVGVLVLSNSNTFSAGIVSGGTVVADSAFALGAGAVTFSGATLSVTNPAVTVFSSPLAVGAGGLTVSHAANLELAGAITGSNNVLTKTGAAALTLSGAVGANKAGVVLNVSSGTLVLSGAAKEIGGSCLFDVPVVASNLSLNLNQSCTVSGNGLLSLSGSTVSGVFGVAGSTSVVGVDTDFSGTNTITSASGRIVRFETGSISGSGLVNITGNGTVQMVGTNDSTFSGVINYATTNANNFVLSAQTAENVAAITNTGQLILTNASPGAEAAIAAVISGGGSVTKEGAGDIVLAGSNSYAGTTTINAGRLAGSAVSIPGNVTVASGAAFVLRQNTDGLFTPAVGGLGSLVKEGAGNMTLAGSNTFTGGASVNGGTLTVSAANLPSAVTNNATLVFNQSGDAIFANPIAGAGLLVKSGSGTLALSSSNSYSGGTVISGGTLKAGNLRAFGAGSVSIETGATLDLAFLDITNQINNNGGFLVNSAGGSLGSFTGGTNDVTVNNSSIVEISGDAVVYISGANTSIGTMSGGTLYVNSSGVTISSYTAGSIVVSEGLSVVVQAGNSAGVISGLGGLTKASAGTLTLSSSNSYTGSTLVSSGRLALAGTNSSIAGSGVTVTNTGVLSGVGTSGATTLTGGGTIAPGTNGTGLINVAGALALKPSGNFNWQLQNAVGAAGVGYDHIAVAGAINLTALSAANKFNVNLGTLSGSSGETAGQASNFNKTQSFTWILATAKGGFTGNFDPSLFNVRTSASNGAEGFANDFAGGSFRVAQEGNSLVLIYSPASIAGAGPIGIADIAGAPNSVAPGQWYEQRFNGGVIPATGSSSWTNNTSLPGWYAATGVAYPTNNFTNIVAAFPSPTNASGLLYSVPQHFEDNTPDSAYRAIAVAPSGASGPAHLALRFVNNTTNTITGFTVSYEMRWGYSQEESVDAFDVIAGGSGYSSAPALSVTGSSTGSNAGGTVALSGSSVDAITRTNSGSGYTNNPVLSFSGGGGSGAIARPIMQLTTSSNSVTLNYKVFDANTGSLANFSSAGWSSLASVTNKNTTGSSVPDNWNYVLATVTNVSVAPGKEVWLSWQMIKQGTTGASIAAIDNVRVGNFGRANPAITAQPMAQSIIMGNNATLSVTASATGTPSYQWRKNGTNVSAATNAALTIANAQPADVGSYDVVVTSGGVSVTSSAVPVQVYTRAGVVGAATNNLAVAPALTNYTATNSYRDISVANISAYTNKFDLYVPSSPGPSSGRPAVVVIHGGGGNDGDKADSREVQACQEFASHGYVALSINYKRSFQTKSTGNWTAAWPQNIKDAKTAVRWLRANAAAYGIDPNRIGAIGFSWGGNESAMLALTDGDPGLDPAAEDGLGVQSTRVSCAANFYGAVQIPDYHNMNQFSGNGVPGSAGTMDHPTNSYLAASPASRASSSAAPMLLHFGDADLEVMPTQNEALRAALNNAGAKTFSVMVPGGKHSYSLYETDSAQGGSATNPIDVRAHTMGFYDTYLLPRAPEVTSASTVSAVKSSTFSHQVVANNGATTFSFSGQTSGFSINPSTGLVTGTMPSSGTRTLTIYATGPSGTAVQTLTFEAVDGLTVSNTVAGKTPVALGYNLAHFTDSGNGFDWFRSSGVKAARVFMNADELQSQTSPGKTKVTNESSFWSTIGNARTVGTISNTYIRWSDFNYDYTSTTGANDITFKYAFTQLRSIGADILVNITASPGTFPISSTNDWGGKWELWQHFYAQAYLLSRDHGITRFSMFNEPNNWSGLTESDWFQRLRVCSDAIQRAIADVNAAKTNTMVPRIYAPNTASGKEKYNTLDDTWGRDTIVNRYLQLAGTNSPTWSPKGTSVPWSLSQVYNYQKYSMLTHDEGSLTGYVDDINALRGYIDADNGAESVPPMALTEYNVRTGSSYDTKTENQDTPSDYVALGANSVALTANGADELFLFKFGQTASGGATYEVAKNGTHYVQNTSGTANNYGGATKAARVYQLFNKAAIGGRDRLGFSTTSGANTNTSTGLWSMVTRDTERNLVHIFLANKGSSAVPLALNLSSLGVPEGAPVILEEVSGASSGQGSVAGNVSGGQIGLGSIPGASVWLATVPQTASSLFTLDATDDAEISDGSNRNLPNGYAIAMRARADGTANGRRAVLVKIPVTSSQVGNGRRFYLDLELATTSGTTPIQAHVYGVSRDSWDEANITWATSSFLRQNVGTGNQIAYNIASNGGSNALCRILGAVVADSTVPSRALLDVTDFVKTQNDGFATFLVLQDHRWDYSADPVSTRTTGDTQSAGLVVSSHEKAGGAARLIGLSSGAPSAPPAILAAPADQYLNVGETVTLGVTADLSSAVTYQWFKEGEVIAGANGRQLVITNATVADAGVYTVDVTNAFGTTTSSGGTVAINAAPALVTPLANVNATSGDPVVLAVVFSGSPPPSYTWSKDGFVISGANASSYTFIAGNTSGGTYTVTAQNSAGSASSSATVTVTAAATGYVDLPSTGGGVTENFNTLGKSTSYRIGTTTYFAWTNGEGWQSNSTTFVSKPGWYGATDDNRSPFEGYRTANDGNEDLDTTPTRTRSGLASMGSGSSSTERSLGGIAWTNNRVYWGVRIRNSTTNAIQGCTVIYSVEQYSATSTNRSGTKIVAASAVNVASLRSPGWTGFGTNTQFVYRTTETYRGLDGTVSTNGRRLTNTVNNLSVAPGDSLWLRWEISTTTGYPLGMAIDDVVVTNFTAAGLPTILSNPVSLTKVSGETAFFQVAASGQPAPSLQWLKNDAPIEGATESVFSLSPVRASDAGTYSVRVSNVAGTNTSAPATLSILQRPASVLQTPSASAITYGETLGRSTLSGGEGSVPGSFSFATPALAPGGGTNEQQVTFWPEDTANYSPGLASLLVTVNRAPQSITFGPLPSKTVGDPAFSITASAGSGLPLQFDSSNTNVATMSGSLLTIHGAGSSLIVATQTGDSNYLPAGSVTQVFSVSGGGTSFAAEFEGATANSDSDADGVTALLEYALGGSTNRPDWDRLPLVQFGSNQLAISYLARTNDPSLSYVPQATASLDAAWAANGIVTSVLGTTNVGSTVFEMRRSSFAITNETKRFLRLKVEIPQ